MALAGDFVGDEAVEGGLSAGLLVGLSEGDTLPDGLAAEGDAPAAAFGAAPVAALDSRAVVSRAVDGVSIGRWARKGVVAPPAAPVSVGRFNPPPVEPVPDAPAPVVAWLNVAPEPEPMPAGIGVPVGNAGAAIPPAKGPGAMLAGTVDVVAGDAAGSVRTAPAVGVAKLIATGRTVVWAT